MRRNLHARWAILVLAAGCDGSIESGSPSDAGATSVPSGLPCNVDAILAKDCRTCHSSPHSAPMPLSTWNDLQAPAVSDATKKVYELVALRIASDASPMPPPPKPRLSLNQRKTLTDWTASGAPRGLDTCDEATRQTQ